MANSLDLCRILDHFLTSLPHFAVVVFDLNDQVLYHNPVAEELLQCDAGCRLRHDSPSAAQRSLYRLLQGCENHSISSDEIMFFASEGSQQSLSGNVTLLRDYDGNALGYGLPKGLKLRNSWIVSGKWAVVKGRTICLGAR